MWTFSGTLSFPAWIKHLRHCLHSKAFFPRMNFFMYRRFTDWLKHLSHSFHSIFFPCAWTPSSCSLRFPAMLKHSPHGLHSKGLSPVWSPFYIRRFLAWRKHSVTFVTLFAFIIKSFSCVRTFVCVLGCPAWLKRLPHCHATLPCQTLATLFILLGFSLVRTLICIFKGTWMVKTDTCHAAYTQKALIPLAWTLLSP